MIGIGVSDAEDIEIVPPGLLEILAKLFGKIAALVCGIVDVPHGGIIDEDLPPVGEIDAKGVGIAERKGMNASCHIRLQYILAPGLPASGGTVFLTEVLKVRYSEHYIASRIR
ncbi:hypothetical protein [Methyloceanibacter stevinii]|uniref:hypothetical protein n=1 Tax=Methyloceanibacter stevinii TaxID=1774970 RepID=UPI0019D39B57|nr:hypothetical protein [Methyloceanibacter stevinii]